MPRRTCDPVGNAGNISAYWRGYSQYASAGKATRARGCGVFRRWRGPSGADIRFSNPRPSLPRSALATRHLPTGAGRGDESGGLIEAVSDQQTRRSGLRREEGIFVEPASAAGVAGLLAKHQRGEIESGLQIAVTVTGHGLKDVDTALSRLGPIHAEV